ncbi:MAG: TVP38/TMEM64 family protein [Gemmatimonadaceae bacterium]
MTARTSPLVVRRVAIACLVAAFAIACSRSDAWHRVLLEVLGVAERLIHEHPQGGMLVFLGLAVLSAMLAFFSSAVFVPVGVYAWGAQVTLLLLWAGWIVGGVAGYWMARTLGRRLGRWLAPSESVARYDAFAARANWRVVLLFQLALPSELPSYVLGFVRYPFVRYLTAVMVAELPFAVIAVYLGDALLKRHALEIGITLAVALLLSTILWREIQRRLAAFREGPAVRP